MRALERVHVDLAQRGQQPLVGQAGEEAVDRALEVGEVALGICSEKRMYSKPLACRPCCWRGQVGEVLGGDRRPARVVVLPRPRAASGGGGSSPSGYRVSDQISISVSSGPSGRNRYDEALLYIGSTKQWGKQ